MLHFEGDGEKLLGRGIEEVLKAIAESKKKNSIGRHTWTTSCDAN